MEARQRTVRGVRDTQAAAGMARYGMPRRG